MGDKKYAKVKYSKLFQMFWMAEGLYHNYTDLKRKYAERKNKPQYDDIISVAGMNGFFAVELYLKLIFALDYWEDYEKNKEKPENETKFPVGHDIKKLYESLDDHSKKRIHEKLLDNMTEEMLLEKLEKYKNGFVEWRYVFEKYFEEGDFDFLSKILDALSLICKRYMDDYNPEEEWKEEDFGVSVTMYRKQVNSVDEARELLDMSLEEVMKEKVTNKLCWC